jgi:hypothetical protein
MSSTRSALAGYSHNDRNLQPRHLPQIDSDRLRLAALLGVYAGVSAGRIYQRENGAAEFFSHLHHSQRFSVPIGFGHSEVPDLSLTHVPPLLLGDYDGGTSLEHDGAAHHGRIVAEFTIPVELAKIRKNPLYEVFRIRPTIVPGQLHTLHRLPAILFVLYQFHMIY